MSSLPYLRQADDGTFELIVPGAKGRVHILPYCFHTEEDAMRWLSSPKGREHISKISARPQSQFPAEHAGHAG
jgi:hypothetical protein